MERALEKLENTYKKEGALWLETTNFGDDKDRVLTRSSGEPTYFAADIAYHEVKLAGNHDRLFNIWGADHHGYVRRMKAAFEAMGGNSEQLEVLIMQLVQLIEKGERAQRSKRKGEFVTLDELIDDIGIDAARFFLIYRSHNTAIDLDLDLARSQSQDNPVYYVQYAHARIASLLRKADEELDSMPEYGGAEVELHDSEKGLIRFLLWFPNEIRNSATDREPHVLATYAEGLASAFTAFYRDCPVITAEGGDVLAFRLQLCRSSKYVLARCLDLLGIEAPEQM